MVVTKAAPPQLAITAYPIFSGWRTSDAHSQKIGAKVSPKADKNPNKPAIMKNAIFAKYPIAIKRSVIEIPRVPYRVSYFLPYFFINKIELKEDSQYHIIKREGTMALIYGIMRETHYPPYDITILIPAKGQRNE